MKKENYLWVAVLICLVALFSAGCETMVPEWSGTMTNESGRHVQPLNLDRQNNRQAIRPTGATNRSAAEPRPLGPS